MSAVASKAESAVIAAPAATEAGSMDLVESPADAHETRMTYGPSSGIPILVILVWVCAFTCLGIYCASFYYPDLAAWRRP
jgi:hypothetical protein